MIQKDLLDCFFAGSAMGRSSALSVARMENGARVLLSYDEPIAVQSQVRSTRFYIVEHDYSPRTNKHIGAARARQAVYHRDLEVVRATRYEIREFAGLDPDVPCVVRRAGHRTVRNYCTPNGAQGTHVPLGEVA